jgi:hypothetical protein
MTALWRVADKRQLNKCSGGWKAHDFLFLLPVCGFSMTLLSLPPQAEVPHGLQPGFERVLNSIFVCFGFMFGVAPCRWFCFALCVSRPGRVGFCGSNFKDGAMTTSVKHNRQVLALDVPVALASIGRKNSICGRFVCFVMAALAWQAVGI